MASGEGRGLRQVGYFDCAGGGQVVVDGEVAFIGFQVAGVDGTPQPPFTGCHQPAEEVRGTEIPVAWFAHGLRVVDIADPHRPQEVASFMPPVPGGQTRVSSNDVFVDRRGLIYLIDRGRGLHILERV